jgi:hypothetical protein
LSRSEPLTFDAWIAAEFARSGGFTALVLLVGIGELTVTPLRSTWFHVVGPNVDWTGMQELLSGAGGWDGVLFVPRTDGSGGPLPDRSARIELQELAEQVIADRSLLNAGHFFDRRGRRLRVDEVPAQ